MNPLVDVIDLEIDGRKVRLAFTLGTLCAYEQVIQKSSMDLIADLQEWSEGRAPGQLRGLPVDARGLRAILWGCTHDAEGHPTMTIEQAGALVRPSTVSAMLRGLMSLAAAAFPDREPGDPLAGPAAS